MTIRPIASEDREAFDRAFASTPVETGSGWVWLALCGDDNAPVVFVPVRPVLEVGTVARDPQATGNPMQMLREFTEQTALTTPVFKRATGERCEKRLAFLGGEVTPTGYRYDGE